MTLKAHIIEQFITTGEQDKDVEVQTQSKRPTDTYYSQLESIKDRAKSEKKKVATGQISLMG